MTFGQFFTILDAVLIIVMAGVVLRQIRLNRGMISLLMSLEKRIVRLEERTSPLGKRG
jgi:hypothetical protein